MHGAEERINFLIKERSVTSESGAARENQKALWSDQFPKKLLNNKCKSQLQEVQW